MGYCWSDQVTCWSDHVTHWRRVEDLGLWTGKAVEHCGWGLASLPVSSSVSAAFSLIWFDFHSPISVFSRAEVFILTEPSVFYRSHSQHPIWKHITKAKATSFFTLRLRSFWVTFHVKCKVCVQVQFLHTNGPFSRLICQKGYSFFPRLSIWESKHEYIIRPTSLTGTAAHYTRLFHALST